MKDSLIHMAGLPAEFGLLLLVSCLGLALTPYLAGHDFGALKIPVLPNRISGAMRYLGPLLFGLALLAHIPIFPATDKRDPYSFAVLPFENLSQDDTLRRFAEDIVSELTNLIAAERELKVTARVGSSASQAQSGTLKAKYFFEGTVRGTRESGTLEVTLASTESQIVLLTKTYRLNPVASVSEVFKKQSIARAILTATKVHLGVANSQEVAAALGEKDGQSASRGEASLLLGFRPNSSNLSDSALTTIDVVAEALNAPQLRDYRFEIVGHSKGDGWSPEDNLRLSEARAIAVKAALVERGVASERLLTIGKGSADLNNHSEPLMSISIYNLGK